MSPIEVLLQLVLILIYQRKVTSELPSYCKHVILSDRKGSISTDNIVRPAIYCHQWVITTDLFQAVTVSFSEINLGRIPETSCSGASLKIDDVNLCNQSTPYVHRSKGTTQVVITYMQNSSLSDVGFSLKYIKGLESPLTTCYNDEWKCHDGYCIPPSWQCNGVPECRDSSDENKCQLTTPAPLICSSHQIKCTMNQTAKISVCLDYDSNLVCNGRRDCVYGEDENVLLCGMTPRPSQVCTSNIKCHPYWAPTVEICLNTSFKCDGKQHCLGNEDEDPKLCGYPTTPEKVTCRSDQIRCRSAFDYGLVCLNSDKKCDGNSDCLSGEDEDPSECNLQNCIKYIELYKFKPYGYITSPRYPYYYPDNVDCTWHIHSNTNDKIQLRFKSFSLQNEQSTDYVSVFDGPSPYRKHIDTYYGKNMPPLVIESSSNQMTIVFHSDSSTVSKGFNFTYQNKGSCYPGQRICGTEFDCYDQAYRCNGVWDCPVSGADELNCYPCSTSSPYTCGPRINQCYDKKQRCNGVAHCTNMMDELYCTSSQCGPHNGTFLCDNGRCIYQTWQCDKTNDCGDNSDEQDCSHATNLIKIAAVSGALICGLLLVVAFGCTCKLYNLRVHGHRQSRQETPLSRLYAEFMRRRAPPPYHEAMMTSRPYDEVRRDYLEQIQQNGGRPPSRRSRRNRNRNQNNTQAGQNETESQSTTNDNENTDPGPASPQEVTQNSVNIELERQNSTSLLLPESSSTSGSDSDDDENQTESVQVSISEENIVTAAYSRGGNHILDKSDSDSDIDTTAPNQTHTELDSVDVCSVDATIASCDSVEDTDKPLDVVVVETISRIRHGSVESLMSEESEENSYGEFTIAEI